MLGGCGGGGVKGLKIDGTASGKRDFVTIVVVWVCMDLSGLW